MTTEIPAWLSVMRTLTGTKEIAGPEANPVITGMTDEIARIWSDVPGMEAYCDQPAWDSDETAWCGVAAGYCVSQAGYLPPFGNTDTTRFGWADSFRTSPDFVRLSSYVPGAIVVMTRSGGNHVTFFESESGSNINCRGGNQSNSVNVTSFPKSNVTGIMWPKKAPMPKVPRATIQKGSKGPDVVACQTTLGLPPAACDGDFGPVTDGAVKGYQAACGLNVDGVVGPNTWTALDALDARKAAGSDGLEPELVKQICELAANSAIAGYQWRDRGRAPVGYTQGVALCFARAMVLLEAGDGAAWQMARAETGDPNKDALTWYRAKFQSLGMDNSQDGIDTLRHLFALMLGLGMRESSGRYCEGRDMSASNVQADTAEAGAWQTSWNIRSCDAQIPPLLPLYWENPNGFLPSFQNGVAPDSNDLGNFGSGGGAQYQFLSKFAPAFHAFVTGLGMRSLRQHWGPINRQEVELKPEADDMLWQAQELVASGVTPAPPEPEPEPPAEVPTITISINPPGSAQVVIIGSAGG